MGVVVIFFLHFFSCFVVAKCDLVQDVETIFHFYKLLIASGNFF